MNLISNIPILVCTTAFLLAGQAVSGLNAKSYKIVNHPSGGSVITTSRDGEDVVVGITDYSVSDNMDIPAELKDIFPSLYSNDSTSVKKQSHDWPSWPDWLPCYTTPISPFITTHWGQGWPYNEQTPGIDGKHTLAGCTAVVLAQILRYYKAPRNFSGIDGPVNNNPCQWWTLTPTTFDFDKMLDIYPAENDGSVPQENVDAVAKLMYYCAQSVNTSYGLNESTAISNNLSVALTDIYGYQPIQTGLRSEEYSYNHDGEGWRWFDLVYDLLENHGPIIFTGSSRRSGSHFFIVDGYKEHFLFHFNLGWGGAFDGYYDIRAMASENFDFSDFVCMYYGFIPPSQSGIETLLYDKTQQGLENKGVSVYTLSGQLMTTAPDKSSACANLAPGVYILQENSVTSKIVIH